jgi:hypothetical protein
MVNCRELLGSSEITALLSGLRQPGPLGRLNKVFLACDTAEGCIYCGHKELKKMETLEPNESEG